MTRKIMPVAPACLALLGACGLAPPSPAAETFGPAAVSIAVGGSPGVVAIADLDADGVVDLAVPNFGSDSVSVLLGDGFGGFTRTPDIAVGEGPFSIVVGDFDNDGAADLAVTNFRGQSVSILLGDGSGGFERTPPDDVPVGDAPFSIAAGDFDRDGATDLVVADRDDDNVSILLGDGSGSFPMAQEFDVGVEPFSVLVNDLDADGDEDLAVVNYIGESVSILLGDGSGNFEQIIEDIVVGNRPSSVVAGDFNDSGATDLAVATLFGDSVRILLGDGLGNFDLAPEEFAVGDGPFTVSSGDFNGDGEADLATVNFLGDSVSILLGRGRGDFARSPDIAVGETPRSAAVGDLNRDGAPDLAVSNFGEDSVTVLLGDGIGDFSRTVDLGVGISPRSVAVGDFNRDAVADIAAGSFGDDTVSIFLGEGDGSFGPLPQIPVGDGPRSLAVADFDADGAPDLAVANFNDNSVSILLGDGDGSFGPPSDIDVGTGPRSVAAGDLDGDRDTDLVVANQSAGQFEATVSILSGDGQGGFERLPDIGVGGIGSEPSFVIVDDLDRDGAADVVVSKLGAGLLSVLLGDGSGGFERTPPGDVPVGDAPFSVAAGDFDGNGDVDLVVANSGGDTLSVLFGDGSGVFPRIAEVKANASPFSVAVDDFNADGAADLAVSSFDDNLVTVLLGDGVGGFFRTPENIAVGPAPVAIAAEDFNGDGVADLAVVNEVVTDELGDAVSLLLNQLPLRADLNGSNQIDGFDVAAVSRLCAVQLGDKRCSETRTQSCSDAGDCPAAEDCVGVYRRNVDVNFDGMIDGDDLTLVAQRFGERNRIASPLRATLDDPVEASPGTITVQPVASEGDRLTVQILVHDDGFSPAAAADFVLTFAPIDFDDNPVQVLEALGSEPGTYLAGGATPFYNVLTSSPGEARVSVSRIPVSNRTGSGEFSLLSLFFRAKRTGDAVFRFTPTGDNLAPRLLNADADDVPEAIFVSGGTVSVGTSREELPGQRLGFAPELLDFVGSDGSGFSSKSLRISNFGFSELTVSNVQATLSEFTPFSTGFSVPPFGFVELSVVFTPTSDGFFSDDLTIESDDPLLPRIRVPVLGSYGLDLGVTPSRVDFGAVNAGDEKTVEIRLTNREDVPLVLTLQSSELPFVARAGFSILEPEATETIEVTFRPTAPGEFLGVLTVGFAEKRVVMSLLGTGQ